LASPARGAGAADGLVPSSVLWSMDAVAVMVTGGVSPGNT
jgi:hypothetical protein